MSAPPEPIPDAFGNDRLRRATFAGVVVVALVGLGLYGWSTLSANRRITEATRALDAGDLDHAAALIARIVDVRPDSADGHYLSARLAWARKQPDDVLPHLMKARERGYPQAPSERLLGLLYAASGRSNEAEPLLRQAWDAAKGPDPEVADALCRIYFESFRFPPALSVANAWAKKNPKDLRPLLWIAEIRTRDDSSPEAQILAFDHVLARDSKQLPSLLGRASALKRIGRLDDARKDYDTYLKADPQSAEAHVGAAKVAEGLDDEDDALAHYDRALKSMPDDVVSLIGKAAILIRRKSPEAAIPLLDKAIAGAPIDPEPHYRKGQALDRLGKREEAAAEFATRVRLQQEQEQIEKIRKRLVKDPQNVSLMADAASWLLGHGYEEMGLEWAEKTLNKQPKHLATIKLLADYFAKKGNVGRANFYRLMLPATSQG